MGSACWDCVHTIDQLPLKPSLSFPEPHDLLLHLPATSRYISPHPRTVHSHLLLQMQPEMSQQMPQRFAGPQAGFELQVLDTVCVCACVGVHLCICVTLRLCVSAPRCLFLPLSCQPSASFVCVCFYLALCVAAISPRCFCKPVSCNCVSRRDLCWLQQHMQQQMHQREMQMHHQLQHHVLMQQQEVHIQQQMHQQTQQAEMPDVPRCTHSLAVNAGYQCWLSILAVNSQSDLVVEKGCQFSIMTVHSQFVCQF